MKIFNGGIKAVALRAGIEPINVSRALNGEFRNEKVESEARKFIKEKISEASRLMEQQESKRAAA